MGQSDPWKDEGSERHNRDEKRDFGLPTPTASVTAVLPATERPHKQEPC